MSASLGDNRKTIAITPLLREVITMVDPPLTNFRISLQCITLPVATSMTLGALLIRDVKYMIGKAFIITIP